MPNQVEHAVVLVLLTSHSFSDFCFLFLRYLILLDMLLKLSIFFLKQLHTRLRSNVSILVRGFLKERLKVHYRMYSNCEDTVYYTTLHHFLSISLDEQQSITGHILVIEQYPIARCRILSYSLPSQCGIYKLYTAYTQYKHNILTVLC